MAELHREFSLSKEIRMRQPRHQKAHWTSTVTQVYQKDRIQNIQKVFEIISPEMERNLNQKNKKEDTVHEANISNGPVRKGFKR